MSLSSSHLYVLVQQTKVLHTAKLHFACFSSSRHVLPGPADKDPALVSFIILLDMLSSHFEMHFVDALACACVRTP
jgi:hypothetical protein